MRPRLLDLFCGAGGAAVGYHRAGFDVVGVDNKPQPRYPFTFIQVDALEVLQSNIDWPGNHPLSAEYDAIHASPPCQAYGPLRARWPEREYPDLIAVTRELMQATGLPYVIENVPGAPLIDPTTICGSSLGLTANGRRLRRHRLFETSWPLFVPPCAHAGEPVIGVYGHGGGGQMTRGFKATADDAREVLGTPWMTLVECSQAIPPAYTELIGHQLLAHIRVAA